MLSFSNIDNSHMGRKSLRNITRLTLSLYVRTNVLDRNNGERTTLKIPASFRVAQSSVYSFVYKKSDILFNYSTIFPSMFLVFHVLGVIFK
jgi:hypothetical protein